MSVDAAVRAPEPLCRPIGAAQEQDTASDETGPQIGPDWSNEWVVDLYAEHSGVRCERIVRCRDCKYYEPNTYSHFTCELLAFHVQPDDFCAWGERRAE